MIKFELVKQYPLVEPRDVVSAYATDPDGSFGAHSLTAEEAIAVSLINIHTILVYFAQKMDVSI